MNNKPAGTQPDPLKPSISLLIKLGSLVVHADEFLSPNGHPFDRMAFDNGLQDAEVQQWIRQMTKQAFLPVKRTPDAIKENPPNVE